MKKTEFELLSLEEKADLLYTSGVYLGKLNDKGLITVFFQLEGFYAAVNYLVYRKTIASIQCYETTDVVEPFLSDINIEELINQ